MRVYKLQGECNGNMCIYHHPDTKRVGTSSLQSFFNRPITIRSARNILRRSTNRSSYCYLCHESTGVCCDGYPSEGTIWTLLGDSSRTVIRNVYGNTSSTVYTFGGKVYVGPSGQVGGNPFFEVIPVSHNDGYYVYFKQGDMYLSDQNGGLALVDNPREWETFLLSYYHPSYPLNIVVKV